MKVIVWILAIFGFLQLFQIERQNPPIDHSKELQADGEILALLRRACYDCHSNETKYPAYSYVAPISWAIASNIKNGRNALNFSEWSDMDAKLKKERIDRFAQLIRNGLMPKPIYLTFHKEAILSKEEKEQLINWVERDLKRE